MTVAIVDNSSKNPATPFAVLIDKGKATSTTLWILKYYTPEMRKISMLIETNIIPFHITFIRE